METAPAIELCHVFLLVAEDGPEAGLLRGCGLRESFAREHPGQGTANVCYCFDNAYLELLRVTDRAALNAPGVAETGLGRRTDWRRNGTNPFGIALRTTGPTPFAAWDYRAPFLPDGRSIPIARSSDDPGQPFLFLSPGDSRPDRWEDGRSGTRQTAAGLGEIRKLELSLAAGVSPSGDLERLTEAGLLSIRRNPADPEPRLVLTISRRDGGAARRLELPAMRWLDPT